MLRRDAGDQVCRGNAVGIISEVYAVSVAQYDLSVGVGDVFRAFEIDDEAAFCCDASAKVFNGTVG